MIYYSIPGNDKLKINKSGNILPVLSVDKDNYTYFANRFDVNKVIYENKITWLVNSGNQEILINTENGNVISRKILTYKE